ncbi:hypothetical protein AB0J86_38555 [Micromonospora sp. NPDC049559]|uniref:hypothetical protein n=1 Tax=Micromonospora sp. NPDC049559 TaxID=3155923 RepID=UPI00342C5BF7
MAVSHALVLALALLGVLCLPAVLAAIICADELVDRAVRRYARWRRRRSDRRTVSRLGRALAAELRIADADLAEFDRTDRASIEQIAAELRRLGGQRLGESSRAGVWHQAILRAYDERLRLASRCLGVAEHLADLEGLDLEIERIRVEGELQGAGMVLPTGSGERRYR